MKKHPRFASLPVVILTNSSMQADLDLALSLGATDYVVKPFDFEKLCAQVNGFVAR